jgi:hypothetical protein
MKRAANLLLCIVGLVCFLTAQDSPPKYVVHAHCDDGLPHFRQWFETTKLPSGQPFVANQKRKRQLLQNYSELHLHMTLEEAVALLGAPDFSEARARGHLSNQTDPAARACSDQVAYVLLKTSDNMADMNDVAVYLFFSSKNELTWAFPQNISELRVIGGPEQ